MKQARHHDSSFTDFVTVGFTPADFTPVSPASIGFFSTDFDSIICAAIVIPLRYKPC